MSDPYYRMFPREWDDGTAPLTLEQEGALLRICNAINSRGQPLPDDEAGDREMMHRCRVSLRKWRAIKAALAAAGKITLCDGKIYQDRALAEVDHRADMAEARAENGAKGGRKRAENRVKTARKQSENEIASNKNNDIAQAYPEPEPDSPTAKADRGGEKPPLHSESFETFWSVYPMTEGVSRRKAETEWQALSPDERDAAIAALPRFAVIQAKRDAPFCPAPAKWLAEKRFETVLPEKPRSVTALRPAELTDSAEHKFLSECRNDMASGWDYWISGGFQIVEFNGQTVCVVSRRIDEFSAAFRSTAKRLGYLIWPDAFYQKQLEKAVA